MTEIVENQIDVANEVLDTVSRAEDFGVRTVLVIIIMFLAAMMWHQERAHREVESRFYGDVLACWSERRIGLPQENPETGDLDLVLESSLNGQRTPPAPVPNTPPLSEK